MRNHNPAAQQAHAIEKSVRRLSRRRSGRLREPPRRQKEADEINVYFSVLYLD